MSLITRCPSCQTSFRVVPDQLRMSEGWARCGQCSEIFDATSSLQDDALPQIGGGDAVVDVNIDEGVEAKQSAVVESTTESISNTESLPQPASAKLNVATDEAMALKAALQEIVSARQSLNDVSESDNLSGTTNAGQSVNASTSTSLVQQQANEAEAPSFLRELPDSPQRFAWHKTWVRVSLALVCLVLSALLLVQGAVHERDRLATLFPQAKPALEAACGYLNCTVSTLRQIDAVLVESSTFSKIRNDTYRLSLAIKNTAPYELAMPAVELTLTDAQDQAMLRRVISGAEVNLANRLAANSEWTGAIDLSLRSVNGTERIAGYRVLVFYP